ncbi:MAG: DnaK suppressor protein [Actinomycetota bacterium]|nr:DnaK suppressor protein [Actinomycetota bacterium]
MSRTTLVAKTATTDDALQTRRQELIAVRESSLDQVKQMRTVSVELVEGGGGADVVDDGGFGEGATLEVERGRILAVASNAATRIDQVDAALRRIDSGNYGICERCRQPIAPARLEALPEATQCVMCASRPAIRLG